MSRVQSDISIPGYRIGKEIGVGGMARVYVGVQESLGRKVALKVLHRHLVEGEDFKHRFLHEGRLLAKLTHPNIVAIHDIGQADDIFYMAMEFLPDGTLSEKMREGLPMAEIIRIVTQIAHALQLAHDHRIVHRDLKPSNIMFRDELTPILTDFGIARRTDAQSRLTKTGMVVGTPHYMSPEQISSKDVDGRSDIYSLGVMFFELLTGQLPFRAEEPLALAMQHVQETPPRLPDQFVELQPIMDALLAKSPDDRFQSMLEFCHAVKDLVANEPEFAAKLTGETKLFHSEQFSDPRFLSDSQRLSGRRTGPGSSGLSTRVSRSAKLVSSVRKIPWKIPAIVTGVAAASILTWFIVSKEDDGLSEQQRRRAESMLILIDNHIVGNRIVEPPEDNALEVLQQVLLFAPQYGPAQERSQAIAALIAGQANLKLGQNQLEQAGRLADQGLSIAPNDQSLQELKQTVQNRLQAIETRRQVTSMLATADQRFKDGQLIEPEEQSAYQAYRDVLRLDQVNASASRGLVMIQETLIETVGNLLNAEDLQGAGELLGKMDKLFPNSSLVLPVRNRYQAQLSRAQEEQQLAGLRSSAERQLAAQQLVEPVGDNALETYQTILTIRPSDREALQGLDRIAQRFADLAQGAFDQQNYSAVVDYARLGLRADPQSTVLIALRSSATDALDSRSRQIEESLQQAERLVQAGELLPGDGQNALDAYNYVLELDPGNMRAEEGLRQLPDLIFRISQQLQQSREYINAEQMLDRAIAQYPGDQRFVDLKQSVATELAQQQRQQRLQALVGEARRLIAVRPLTESSVAQATAKLAEIRQEFPQDPALFQQTASLARAIAAEADRVSTDGDDAAAFSLLDAGLQQVGDHPALRAAQGVITERQQQRIAEERQRIAAISGVLTIDASPWGEVLEISNRQGESQSLPENATTPLVISLVEGDYRVMVRSGNGGAPREVTVKVERQKRALARVDFDVLTAESYFETSGW